MAILENKRAPVDTPYAWNGEDFYFLKDHCVQGMEVLPGTFYLHMAVASVQPNLRKSQILLKDVSFRQMFLWPDIKQHALHIELTKDNGQDLTFTCYSRQEGKDKIIHATGKITGAEATKGIGAGFHPEEKIPEFRHVMPGEQFYDQLALAGNQFGPGFQGVQKIWYGQKSAMARISLPKSLPVDSHTSGIHPALADACIQVLSSLRNDKDKNRTFVLKSLDHVAIHRPAAVSCWSLVTPADDGENQTLKGNIQVVDDRGRLLMEITGAALEFIDFDGGERPAATLRPEECIALSATFTADLLEQPLTFWSDQLEIPFRVELAPYNQVFQQLLDPASVLSGNRKGLNVLLIRFEDWVNDVYGLKSSVSESRKKELFKEKDIFLLPNHVEIAHLNQYETEYVFKEIFIDQCYLRHGIEINKGDCILDIGANIGLFSLFALQHGQDMEIYAFEPSPVVYDLLKINASLYGPRVKTFNCGVSDKTKQAEFTFYKKSSVFSSFSADTAADKEAIKAVINNMLSEIHSASPVKTEDVVEEIMKGRLDSSSSTCPLKSVSDIITENGIQKIDLLKIDAEKSELDILEGINEEHWPIIKQIVIEVHDKEGAALAKIENILHKKGFTINVEEEKLLQHSGLFNVFATHPERKARPDVTNNAEGRIRANIQDLCSALSSSANRGTIPYLLCSCPPSPAGKVSKELHKKMEGFLGEGIKNTRNVYLMASDEVDRRYPVQNFYDRHSDKIGHIPFTAAYFNALGTSIARKYKALTSKRYKVILLDCDHTLWEGVCGEEGPLGVKINEGHAYLQDFMIGQQDAGMLLCLCSKNNSEDIDAVFDTHPEMRLKAHHIVSKRINWQPKSENIKSIAAELQLGLDSFVFIDDNPVEIAEVQANCPGVLAIRLPKTNIREFLDHIWDFDHMAVTGEDRNRTLLYHQNIRRENFRQTSLTFKNFLDSLQLDIKILTPQPAQWERVSQLTFRTNQFNFTTKRRTAAEVRALMENHTLDCRIVTVADRFGDYGIVGVMLFSVSKDALSIESFMLSCRALGKGVEHQMMRYLGTMAQKTKAAWITAGFIPTPRNRPALYFLESIGHKEPEHSGYLFRFPVASVVNLTFSPSAADAAEKPKETATEGPLKTMNTGGWPAIAMHIASHLNTAEKIQKSIEAKNTATQPVTSGSYEPPSNEVEKSITEIWKKVLGNVHVGINDNFFDVGGTSLKGVQLIGLLKQQFDKDTSIVNLFERPTIRAMAQMFGHGNQEPTPNIVNAQERGARRRKAGVKKRPRRQ